jgi:hypothetical protein
MVRKFVGRGWWLVAGGWLDFKQIYDLWTVEV